jgi:hypothetical protein
MGMRCNARAVAGGITGMTLRFITPITRARTIGLVSIFSRSVDQSKIQEPAIIGFMLRGTGLETSGIQRGGIIIHDRSLIAYNGAMQQGILKAAV